MNKISFFNQLGQFRKSAEGKVPDAESSQYLLREIIEFLFPILRSKPTAEIQEGFEAIVSKTEDLLKSIGFDKNEASQVCNDFIETIPQVYDSLLKDAKAICDGDPAAQSIEEVIVSYPGFYAIAVYRISHELYKLGIPYLPRIFAEFAHEKTGIDIHPGASIGASFCIDHGTGIVIGETSKIGNYVKIYQGVTLGALSVEKKKAGKKRHPSIEDHVTIYAGSTILGGETTIGKQSVIGGNVWLTSSVEPNSIVLNKSETFIKNKNPDSKSIIDFVI
jgi:serine O-acetyltransferase